MNRQRLSFVASIFLNDMRRQFAKQRPGDPSPIKNLEDYPPDQRSALMASLEQAIRYAGPDGDKVFLAWQLRQQEQAEQDPAAFQ